VIEEVMVDMDLEGVQEFEDGGRVVGLRLVILLSNAVLLVVKLLPLYENLSVVQAFA